MTNPCATPACSIAPRKSRSAGESISFAPAPALNGDSLTIYFQEEVNSIIAAAVNRASQLFEERADQCLDFRSLRAWSCSMVRSCLSRSSSAYLRRAAYSRARDLAASRAGRCRSSCSLRTHTEHAPVAFVVAAPQRLQGFVRRCFRTLCVIAHPINATRNRMISQFALSPPVDAPSEVGRRATGESEPDFARKFPLAWPEPVAPEASARERLH